MTCSLVVCNAELNTGDRSMSTALPLDVGSTQSAVLLLFVTTLLVASDGNGRSLKTTATRRPKIMTQGSPTEAVRALGATLEVLAA